MTLAECYYKVGNDLKIRAAEMNRMADNILSLADAMSEQAAALALEANKILGNDSADDQS
jgi:hypothetical protein